MKKTLVFGASTNPNRYAYLAANKLLNYNYEIELVGRRKGELRGHIIHTDYPILEDIDTITIYVGTKNQEEFYQYLLDQNPRRIIFNPGTENPEFYKLANARGIETTEACTLVMLSAGQY